MRHARPNSGFRLVPPRLGALALVALFCACGGRADRVDASAEDVDPETPFHVTDAERSAFRAPADGVLSESHVEQYLKASVLQFDLVRQHSERLHARIGEMERRAEKGGALAGLRNLAEAGRTMYEVGDIFGGSYVRAARTLGYNPAEMEWVRERIGEVGSYLIARPMHEAALQSAQEMRASVEKLRADLEGGAVTAFSEADLEQMLQSAEEMEASAREIDVAPATLANLDVLRRARPAVSDAMWTTVSFSGGAGLLMFAGLVDPQDIEAQRKLDEFRQVFEDALANRVSAGMESPVGAR
jgi:hypothetical protein